MSKKNRNITYRTEEQKEMQHFLIVLGVVVLLVVGVYWLSKAFVLDNSLFEVNYGMGSINEQRAIVGTMFNRPEKDYYVFAYAENDPQAIYYSAISTKYSNGKDHLKVYHLDLDNALNSSYYVGNDGTSNKSASKVSDVRLKDLTLIRIKNGKIVKYIESIDEIEKELAVSA